MSTSTWPWVPIGDLFEIDAGRTMSTAARKGTNQIPFLRTSNVLWDRIDLSSLDTMHVPDSDLLEKLVTPGDMLVCEGGEIGRAAIWEGQIEKVTFQNHLHRLRPRRADVLPRFYVFFLQSAFTQLGIFEGAGTKTTIPNLSRNRLAALRVPHPDLAEQETIVDRLGRVREAGDIQEKVAAAADELKAALLASAFTRGLRGEAHRETELGPVPERWVEVRLADVGDVVTGTTPPTKEPKYYEGGDFPFITPGDIGHARAIESTQRHLTRAGLDAARSLPSGATCVVCIGATIGKVGLTTVVDSATNQQINAVIPSASYDPKFVFYALSFYADVFRRAATPGPIPLLSKGSFEQLSIHVTPDMGEQREIVAVLQVIDEKVSLHRARNVLLKELFFGLLRQFMANEADPDEVHDSAPSDGVTYLEEVLAT